MNDKHRAEFEKWASQYEYDLTWSDAIDCYAIMRTRVVFDAWQAAIASQKSLYVATYEKSEPIILNKEFVKD